MKVINQVTWSLIEEAGRTEVMEYCKEHGLLHYFIDRTVDISAPEAGLRSKSTTVSSSKITNFMAWQEIENLIQYKFDEAGKRNTTVEVVAIYSRRADGPIKLEEPKPPPTTPASIITPDSNSATKKTNREARTESKLRNQGYELR